MFQIPIAVFIFKRKEKTVELIRQIGKIQPKKIYLIGDGGRSAEEHAIVLQCRKAVEEAITWNCEIIRNYAETNRGVYENIAGGVKWVFETEESAIFLEDDNYPEITFFEFCSQMLDKYRHQDTILWICGTNYLEKFKCQYDYVFTQHMLPCGWASWADKFNRYYDGNLDLYTDENKVKIKDRYTSQHLYEYDINRINSEYIRKLDNLNYISWDYQMAFSLRIHNLYGICPCLNQIKNVGVDTASIHGGNTMDNIMTKRFCGIKSYALTFPLSHPEHVGINQKFEKRITKIVLPPSSMIRRKLSSLLRKVFHIPDGIYIKSYFKGLLK